ncbi:hypothetical protein OY671_010185, partial [Metschnikowia pulcherrima]
MRRSMIAATLGAFLLAQTGEAAAQALAVMRFAPAASAPPLSLRQWPVTAAGSPRTMVARV